MIGELNCGHAYVNPGETEQPKRIKYRLAWCGNNSRQEWLFPSGEDIPRSILEQRTWRSPLTEPGVDVKVESTS